MNQALYAHMNNKRKMKKNKFSSRWPETPVTHMAGPSPTKSSTLSAGTWRYQAGGCCGIC
jgi:hypothetical protein